MASDHAMQRYVVGAVYTRARHCWLRHPTVICLVSRIHRTRCFRPAQFGCRMPMAQLGLRALWQNSKDFISLVVAVLGTTISPYLFFWQSSQEAEDQREQPLREKLTEAPEQAPAAFERIGVDTWIGMALSNLVALAIMLTAGATLHLQILGAGSSQGRRSADEKAPPAACYGGAVVSLISDRAKIARRSEHIRQAKRKKSPALACGRRGASSGREFAGRSRRGTIERLQRPSAPPQRKPRDSLGTEREARLSIVGTSNCRTTFRPICYIAKMDRCHVRQLVLSVPGQTEHPMASPG
jgi:Natural resistance-associated macrophage protein